MTDLPPCQAASELRRLTDAALSAVAPTGPYCATFTLMEAN